MRKKLIKLFDFGTKNIVAILSNIDSETCSNNNYNIENLTIEICLESSVLFELPVFKKPLFKSQLSLQY
jgi:hypothetical protein